MAQVDTSIYNNLQPTVKLQTPFELQGQFQQLQQGQNQNRLAQMQFQKAEREVAQQNALAGAYRDYYAQPTQDPNMLYKNLAGAGQGAAIPGVMETMNKAAKSGVDLNNAKLTGQKMQGEITQAQRERAAAKIGAHLNDPNLTADKILADLQSQVQSGELTMEQAQATAQRLPQDPAQLKPFLNQILMSVMKPKEQVDLGFKERDFGLKVDEFGYRQRNDAANRGVTMRGQDMTDARGRDLNATKVEANNITRDSKMADKELAKSGQIASFDTMLDTLDRLTKHPGLERSVGKASLLNPLTIPGSDSANFLAELDTFQSQAFLPMVAQLKGMGALSDAEGKKLTQAIGALSPKMGKQAFRDSVTRIMTDMNIARERVAGKSKPPATPAPQAAIDLLRKNPSLGPKFKEKYGYLP